MSIRVAVLGSRGRMGSQAMKALEAAEGIDLVRGVSIEDSRDVLLDDAGRALVDVVVDFTVPEATKSNVLWALEHGIHCVVGATGWDDEALDEVRDAAKRSDGVGVLIAPNFAIGAVLAMSFAEKAARFYESAEVLELHHPDKVDAPSGTAAHTAAAIARGRAAGALGEIPDATESDPGGARGAVVDGIHVHAVRLRGLVAHEEILFGGPGEQLSIRHDSFDRASFMPGVVHAVRTIAQRPGLTVGLEHFLDLG